MQAPVPVVKRPFRDGRTTDDGLHQISRQPDPKGARSTRRPHCGNGEVASQSNTSNVDLVGIKYSDDVTFFIFRMDHGKGLRSYWIVISSHSTQTISFEVPALVDVGYAIQNQQPE